MKQIKFLGLMAAMAVLFTGCTDMQQLKYGISQANDGCPMQVDEITTCTRIQLHGDYVEYLYKVDETDEDGDFDVSFMNDPELKKEWKEETLEEVKETYRTDEDYKEFIQLLKRCKYGIEYRYVGNRTSNESVTRLEYWELP